MKREFMVYIQWDAESKMFIGTVPALPAAHSYAPTIELLRENMKEAIELVLEDHGESFEDMPTFISLESISIAG